MDEKIVVKKKFNTSNFVLGAVLSLISLAYIYPIFMVLINALKKSNKNYNRCNVQASDK